MKVDREIADRLGSWAICGFVFLLAFLPRAVHPVSRPMQWHSRAVRFGDAVLGHNWKETYQRYHPGVPTMWLSGVGLKIFAWREGLSSEQLTGAAPTKPGVLNKAVAAGVTPLAVAIASCVAISYVLLLRVAGRKVAFAGSCLLALDPFHITHSKVLHVDGVLATFMLTSVLFLLSYLRRSSWHDLVLSGVFAGLAFLTKSPSYFLVPYTALVVGTDAFVGEEALSRRGWLRRFWKAIQTLTLWGMVASVAFVAFWPAVWVEPVHALRRIGRRIAFHVGTAHYNPVFFNGEVTYQDPGPLFYVATVAWKTTLVTLPMLFVAIALLFLRLRQRRKDVVPWLFAAYALFFTAQMCLSARKELAYLLPAFPALDVLAAFGVAWIVGLVERVGEERGHRWLPGVVMGGILLLQALLVLPGHPYYGTLHNRLLGGSRAAQHVLPFQDQGEGLDLAARFLNTLPRAQRASAGLYRRSASVFRRNFLGLTSIINDPQANYRVYYINQVMRGLGGEAWEKTWQSDRENDPLWTVAFDGVTYVWVYGTPPEKPAAGGPEYAVNYRLGEHVQLDRVRISAQTVTPGDTLTVVPTWTSDGEIETSYKVFCHLLSENGELVAQRDAFPLEGVRQTPSWRAGELIVDSYEIPINDDVPLGEHQLSLGMYDPRSMQRLPVYDSGGERVPHGRIALGSLHVEVEGSGNW